MNRKSLLIFLLPSLMAAAATAGERKSLHDPPGAVSEQEHLRRLKHERTATTPLDRVASAVDGAESSHGQDMTMWRPDPSGPQGPMQVSESAATDVGGGDRFDLAQNRALGRAYLAQLFWRYRNWPDAIAAYNWGIGKMDEWVKAGRPPDKFLVGVAVYLKRVLHESGLCDGADAEIHRAYAACSVPDAPRGAASATVGPGRFYAKLDEALRLTLQRAMQAR